MTPPYRWGRGYRPSSASSPPTFGIRPTRSVGPIRPPSRIRSLSIFERAKEALCLVCISTRHQNDTEMTVTLELPEIGTNTPTAMVARQNDQFRPWHTIGGHMPGIYVPGKSVWTASFEAEKPEFQRAALKAIGHIDSFAPTR